MSTRNSMSQTYRLTCYGLMTALAFVANYIRFPFLGSQITVSNTLCALCGMILGPWPESGPYLYNRLTVG